VAADTTATFPEVEGRNLEGWEFSLPGDFEGEANLVLIAFRREHQALVDTWMPPAAALSDTEARFRYYELPVLAGGYSLFRGFIDGGMRSGIDDLGARERTITLYLDKGSFRESLELPDEDTIYALVVDPAGNVAAREEGRHTATKWVHIERAVRGLLGRQVENTGEEHDLDGGDSDHTR